MEIENSKERETHTANQWRTTLRNRKWAISGYGTVFDQSKKGIIPQILENWFNMRIEYQKRKREAEEKAYVILQKYKNP